MHVVLWKIAILKRVRHLIKRWVFRKYRGQIMPKPGRLIVAGWEASGSTVIFQISRLLGLDVCKTHGKWEDERLDRVIFVIRDPRDVICSHAQRVYTEFWEAGEYEEALLKSLDDFLARSYVDDLFQALGLPNVIVIRYETFVYRSEDMLIRFLADQFMTPLDEERIASILRETSMEANLKRAQQLKGFKHYDKETYIHGLHITNRGAPGAWKRWFTSSVEDAVKRELGDVLVRLGYEKNKSWLSKKRC